MFDPESTIVAAASPAGSALRGVVRMTGKDALSIATKVITSTIDSLSQPQHQLRHPRTFNVELSLGHPLGTLPAEICVWPDDRSYTRQPTVEFHIVSAPPIVDAVVRSCLRAGARMAEPGEFTLRAFLSGRLDLTQAEAVLGVIDAKSKKSLDVALVQLAGGMTQPLNQLREDLINLLADLEAGLDFVDEDIEFVSQEEVVSRLTHIATELKNLLEKLASRGTSHVRPRVVLAGLPNAGKSQLFNALVGSSAALVADVAGTTRDFVSAVLDLGDREIELVDTAGEELATEEIGQSSQSHRENQLAAADLILQCRDIQAGDPTQSSNLETPVLFVRTKADLASVDSPTLLTGEIVTSGVTGEGIETLLATIRKALDDSANAEAAVVSATARRCGDSLERALSAVKTAIDLAATSSGDELVAAELRECLSELGRVVGAVYTEDILDQVFSRFCIGK